MNEWQAPTARVEETGNFLLLPYGVFTVKHYATSSWHRRVICMYLLLHRHASHERVRKRVSDTAERLPRGGRTFAKSLQIRTETYRYDEIRKIVNLAAFIRVCGHGSVALRFTYYWINKQKLSRRSLRLSIIHSLASLLRRLT